MKLFKEFWKVFSWKLKIITICMAVSFIGMGIYALFSLFGD